MFTSAGLQLCLPSSTGINLIVICSRLKWIYFKSSFHMPNRIPPST